MISNKNKMSFSIRELEYLLTLAKDRKFKLERGDLNYSTYFQQIENSIMDNLISKLQDSINIFKEKAV